MPRAGSLSLEETSRHLAYYGSHSLSREMAADPWDEVCVYRCGETRCSPLRDWRRSRSSTQYRSCQTLEVEGSETDIQSRTSAVMDRRLQRRSGASDRVARRPLSSGEAGQRE